MGLISKIVKRGIIIGNGISGAENQCIGLIRALNLSLTQTTLLRVKRPTAGINKWLHKKLGIFEDKGLLGIPQANAKKIAEMACEIVKKDGPLLVVASGRDTVSVASSIKRLAQDNVFVVQIQHPRTHLHRFDLVIAPRHDYYPLSPEGQRQIPWLLRRWITPREPPYRQVVLTVGALHQADSAALQVAARVWQDLLGVLPRPLLVVNIGGPTLRTLRFEIWGQGDVICTSSGMKHIPDGCTGHCQYGSDLAKQLVAALQNILWSCGSLGISFSRRTPRKVSDIVLKEFLHHPKVCIWDGQDPNPHMGHLAWADAFVISADSVSMLSEACSTGKPVYVIGSERCTWKFADFHKSLLERGVVRPFTGAEDISKGWSYRPLKDTEEAASRVIEALAHRGWKLQPRAVSSILETQC